MLESQLSYFETDAAMAAAGDALLRPGAFHHRPTRTLVVLAGGDMNVPPAATNGVQAWATRTVVIGGEGHAIQEQPPAPGAEGDYMPDVERFVREAVSPR